MDNEMVLAASTLGIEADELHMLHDVDVDSAYVAKTSLQNDSENESLIRAHIVLSERPTIRHMKHDCIQRFLKDFKPPKKIAARHLYNVFNDWKSSHNGRLRISEKLFGTVVRSSSAVVCKRGRQGRWYGAADACSSSSHSKDKKKGRVVMKKTK